LIDEVCAYLVSKPADRWTELTEITKAVRKFGLTDAEAESALIFLAKYFLELDEKGEKARLIRSFYDLFRRE
jgi:hypothetical protein